MPTGHEICSDTDLGMLLAKGVVDRVILVKENQLFSKTTRVTQIALDSLMEKF